MRQLEEIINPILDRKIELQNKPKMLNLRHPLPNLYLVQYTMRGLVPDSLQYMR